MLLSSITSREETENLLKITTEQSEVLKTQQVELEAKNEALIQRSCALKASEAV